MAQPRQAVVLIHGVGDQRPMSTLRGFVKCVLSGYSGELDGRPAFYSKPDFTDKTFELKRLVAHRPKRTDFYELYWAHLMPEARWNRLVSWFWLLMWRSPRNVPSRLLPIWLSSWLCLGVLVVMFGQQLWALISGADTERFVPKALPWLVAIAIAIISRLVLAYAGDAAVYFSPAPQNVDARHKIRTRAVDLLETLNKDPRYDRIIVVGHSLGSVVGYDAISLCWQRLLDDWRLGYRQRRIAGEKVINGSKQAMAAERLAKNANASFDLDAWEHQVDAVREEIRANGYVWKFSDFITLGSPLTYGSFLMAASKDEFSERKTQREIPTSPPTLEAHGFTYFQPISGLAGKSYKIRIPHHAAQFAATRWTNLYFRSPHFPGTDLIGGPVASEFGPGARDIEVRTTIWFGFLSHIHYWKLPRGSERNSSPEKLAFALNLDRVGAGLQTGEHE